MAVPFWIKLAASELVRYKLVSSASIHSTHLVVHYKSGLRDKYYFAGKPSQSTLSFKIEEADLKIGNSIPIQRTYEIDPLDESEQTGCAHHLHMDKKYFRAGSFIDGRLAIHRFVALLLRSQPALDQYPERDVRKWADSLRKFNYSRMITKDAFNFYRQMSAHVPWRQVLWQFFPPSLSYRPWKVANILNDAIDGLPALNTTMVNKRLLRDVAGSILNPLAYCAILDRLKVRKAVIDLHPERGYKAIACGLLGIHYIYKECKEMVRARERKIREVLGLTCELLNGQKADIILSDAHFERFDIEGTTPYLHHVNSMVAYAPRADRLELTAKYKPARVVKVLCRYKQGRQFKETAEDPDFLLIW